MNVRLQYVIPGILILALGLLWTLQGAGIVQGSVMTGQRQWLIIGIILAVVGLIISGLGFRGRQRQS